MMEGTEGSMRKPLYLISFLHSKHWILLSPYSCKGLAVNKVSFTKCIQVAVTIFGVFRNKYQHLTM